MAAGLLRRPASLRPRYRLGPGSNLSMVVFLMLPLTIKELLLILACTLMVGALTGCGLSWAF